MKVKQTWCKKCYHYFEGDCAVLLDTKLKEEKPCGEISYSYPLAEKIEKLGGIAFIKHWTKYGMPMCCDKFVYTSELNKGNCEFYKKKWYIFW